MSTDTLTRSPVRKKRRKRFRFSLNGLAIQLSAFALSFTLVALLVVSGSQAAFVEENEVVTQYVPIGTPAPAPGVGRHAGGTGTPSASPPSEPQASETPVVPEPTPEPLVETDAPATQVRLTDSAAGTALFGNETLLPGLSVARCISVTYDGTVDPGPVRLFAAPTSGELAPYLDLTIDIGQGGTTGCPGVTPSGTVFGGTLAGFAAAHAGYATGAATWDPADGQETRTFRVALTVRNDPAGSGKSATFGFSWRTETS